MHIGVWSYMCIHLSASNVMYSSIVWCNVMSWGVVWINLSEYGCVLRCLYMVCVNPKPHRHCTRLMNSRSLFINKKHNMQILPEHICSQKMANPFHTRNHICLENLPLVIRFKPYQYIWGLQVDSKWRHTIVGLFTTPHVSPTCVLSHYPRKSR